jgi:hypothetical protein
MPPIQETRTWVIEEERNEEPDPVWLPPQAPAGKTITLSRPSPRAALRAGKSITLSLLALLLAAQAQARPTQAECDANRVGAAAAAQDAPRAQRELDTALVGSACALTLWLGGASERTITAMCGVAVVGTYAMHSDPGSAALANKTYRQALNPQCLPEEK